MPQRAHSTSNGRFCVHTSRHLERLEPRQLFDAGIPSPGVFDIGQDVASVVTADFDNDGDLDMAVSAGRVVGLLLNNGDGTFAQSRRLRLAAPAGLLAVGDFNGDAFPDLAAAGGMAQQPGHTSLRVLEFDEATDRFVRTRSRAIDADTSSILTINLGGDGRDELLLTGLFADDMNRGNLYRLGAPGRIVFQTEIIESASTLVGPQVVDFGDDGGTPELMYFKVSDEASDLVLLEPSGSNFPTFTERSLLLFKGPWNTFLAGDVDGDGDLDALVTLIPGGDVEQFRLFSVLNDGDGNLGSPEQVYGATAGDNYSRLDAEFIRLIPGEGDAPDLLIQQHFQPEGKALALPAPPTAEVLRLVRQENGMYEAEREFGVDVGSDIWGASSNPGRFVSVADFTGEGRFDYAAANGSRLRVFNYTSGNQAPVIEIVTHVARFTPRSPGDHVRLYALVFNAERPFDEDERTATVRFFLDINGNGRIDGADIRIAVARTDHAFGWATRNGTIPVNCPLGTFNVLARSRDGLGIVGPVVPAAYPITIE